MTTADYLIALGLLTIAAIALSIDRERRQRALLTPPVAPRRTPPNRELFGGPGDGLTVNLDLQFLTLYQGNDPVAVYRWNDSTARYEHLPLHPSPRRKRPEARP